MSTPEFPLYFEMDGTLIKVSAAGPDQIAWLMTYGEELSPDEYKRRQRKMRRDEARRDA
jgi:hypothetical protein